MRFYDWTPNTSFEAPDGTAGWTLRYLRLVGLSDWQLWEGKPVENWDPQNAVYYDEDGFHEDLACSVFCLSVHVYSSRLRALIEGLGIACIQYLPLRIQHMDSLREVSGYFVANYVCVVDALNLRLSDYLLWGPERPDRMGQFRDLKKAVLDTEKIGQARLFRLKRWEQVVVVREDVKRAIDEAGMTGCMFREVDVV